MPVTVFDTDSLVSKHASIFRIVPYFLDRAKNLKSDIPEEALLRFKLCLAYSIA